METYSRRYETTAQLVILIVESKDKVPSNIYAKCQLLESLH